jgi:alpha-methylacyl-CoA racemase
MTDQLLRNFTIIDLSHRLPGPMCGKILSDLGAKVIKIEDEKFQDPFCAGLFAEFDPSFKDWYKNLNSNKQVLRFDFNNPNDQKRISELVQGSDAVIMGLSTSVRKKLKLEDENLIFKKPFVSIELLASREHSRSLHDLNALAEAGLMSLHVQGRNEKVIDPPFLPISGISFGHKAATDLLAAMLLAQKINQTQFIKTYLDESTTSLFGIFWDKQDREQKRKRYLHNGQYPCYSIYQTRDDSYIALAAVEEKFWNRFCELFDIDSKIDRFYDKDNSVFVIISGVISSKSISEITSLIGSEDICLSIIE